VHARPFTLATTLNHVYHTARLSKVAFRSHDRGEEALLRLTGITKSFGGVAALKGVSFELLAGEVHAIIGENGAGKSTLIKIITGAHQPDTGTIELDGQLLTDNSPGMSRARGIAVIYQQPSLFPDLTVAENIGLRLEQRGLWRWVRWSERRRQAIELLKRVEATLSPDAAVRDLSMPQQQLVEIAAALGANAKVLILDEPTASLSERESVNLLRVVKQLRAQGLGIVYISHRLEELPQIADRVTVLRDGNGIGTRPMAEVDSAELIRLMVGRELSAVFPKITVTIGDVVLETRDITCDASGVDTINLTVRAGEILGLAGLVGAGRTELARVLFGLTPATGGSVLLRDKPIDIRTPAEAVAHGIAYVPEDRRRHGVVLEMSVAANTTLAVLRKIASGGMLDFAREQQLAESFVRRFAIKTPSTDTPVGNLSGGNQQKVALARWLATDPAVIILDEPTQGVDVGAKSEIHRLMGELAGRGLAIIMISSELPEVLGMSDRIAVMHGGRIIRILDRAEATQEKVLELALAEEK
jgi:rhamnose transport system ATP-binding protein